MKSYSLDCGTTITKDKRNNNNKQSLMSSFLSLAPPLLVWTLPRLLKLYVQYTHTS